jgi:outer membrane protein assembly factor BamE (lipoprotein component of BamABCDE complex)
MRTRHENRRACARQWLQAVIASALCAALLGCIGAAPLPKHTRTPEGTEVKDIDLSFLLSGQTTRAEVKDKLKLIDTGYQGDHFFVGRWSSSTSGAWAIVLGVPGFAGRIWKSGNLLVEFDDAGRVKRFEPFDDAKAPRYLAPVAADTPLQLASPLELPVKYYLLAGGQFVDAKIVLSKGSFDFEELGNRKKKHKFSLPASEVLRVETPVIIRFPDPTYISQRLRCARDLKKIGGPSGRDINLKVTMPQLVALMSYVAQAAKSPASAPEAGHK